ncbi:potassium-transporting ATPase subunit KdpA [Nevskia ramosa]|uniref:potassium-transporting ATPase subunit KdpA n=1 Tax=Nevskia ramosa TaxID=64002 RepID=UPI0003B5260C|nr:potassium-transporting ATPase subunit KdpA [Nevskia ramosa]
MTASATTDGWLLIALFLLILTLATRPLGGYLKRVFEGERTWLSIVLGPVERGFYKLAGVRSNEDQTWIRYATAMLVFSLGGYLLLFAIQQLQGWLPLNPQGYGALTGDLSLNTAVSFVTNTNWQSYGGESTMSHGTQMFGLAVQNFLSAATGIALAIALIRGFAREKGKGLGNFWVDMTRATLYVLLPLSILLSLFLVWQGTPQNFIGATEATTLEGAKQLIAQGPVASQVAIKMLGTNGGGFFNANAAHPFENPTALANFVQMLAIFLISAALTNTFGRMVKNELQGWAIYSAMAVLFLAGAGASFWAESAGNPAFASMGIDQTASLIQSGGNMEGKEARFGIAASTLFATVTTDASCGAVNSMHDSFTPLGGAVPLVNIMLGEVVFGGVGSGLYGMLLFAIVALFIAGLMVGRTPEYLGKKIEAREIKLTVLSILCMPLALLGFLAVASVSPVALQGLANAGPHGFSEMLYAYTSAVGNNGSAFAGLTANTPFWNLTLAAAMMIGRFAVIVPMLAVAGSLVAKSKSPPTSGSFPTDGPLFIGLLVAIVVIVGGLTYFPALALGPVVEHLAMLAGSTF